MSRRRSGRRGATQGATPRAGIDGAPSAVAERARSSKLRTEPAAPPDSTGPPGSAPRPAPATAVELLPRLELATAATSGALALLLYLRTIAPSLPTGDSGDLITAAWVRG